MNPCDIAFVCGAPRSGTTLLQAILSHTDDAAPLLGEMRYLQHLLRAYAEVKATWPDDSKYFFASPQGARQELAQMMLKHFASVARRYSSRRLVIKAPELTNHLEIISELFPRSARLVTIRHPRDIVASQLRATERETALGYVPSMLTEYRGTGAAANRQDIIHELARGVVRSYRDLPSPDWHLIVYENLVRYPEQALKDLTARTAWPIQFDSAADWPHSAFSYLEESTTFQAAWHSPLWGKPISTERIGVHAGILRPEEVSIVDAECHTIVSMWEAETW